MINIIEYVQLRITGLYAQYLRNGWHILTKNSFKQPQQACMCNSTLIKLLFEVYWQKYCFKTDYKVKVL